MRNKEEYRLTTPSRPLGVRAMIRLILIPVLVMCLAVLEAGAQEKKGTAAGQTDYGPMEDMGVLREVELPASFYNGHDGNSPCVGLTPDGRIAVNIQAPWTTGEGRAYNLETGKTTVFWRNKTIMSGKTSWFAAERMVRFSIDGAYVAFPVFLGSPSGSPADPWGAAVAFVDARKEHQPPDIYDLRSFLQSQDKDIDGARGVEDLDLSGNGRVLYAVVPYHKKEDGEQARTYPIRRAVIRIDTFDKKITLHSTAKKGEQYYPFSTVTTNWAGSAFGCQGGGPGGTDLFGFVWSMRNGWTQPFPDKTTGVYQQIHRGGPIVMGEMDASWITQVPQERGPIRHARWDIPGRLYTFGEETYGPHGQAAIPQFADGRFTAYDGNHAVYRSRQNFWIWYDFVKPRGYRIPIKEGPSRLSVPPGNNPFLSRDGSRILLHKSPPGDKANWRLLVLDVAPPQAVQTINLSGLWTDCTAGSQIILQQEGQRLSGMEAWRPAGLVKTWVGTGSVTGGRFSLTIHIPAEPSGGAARDMTLSGSIVDGNQIRLESGQVWIRLW